MNYIARVFASAVIRKLAYLAVAAVIAFASQCAHAAGSTDIGWPSGISFASDGTPYFQVPKPLATPAVSSDVYMATRYVGVPTSKGLVTSAFGYELPVAVSRLGPYVVKLARVLGPAAMIGMGLDAVLCATANICIIDGLFQKYIATGDQSANQSAQYYSDGPCIGQWHNPGDVCVNAVNTHPGAYTSGDWTAAETSLSTLDVVPPLIMANQPIPVDTPTITVPADKTIAETTEVTRDGTGTTATGTKTSTTTLHLDPPANPSTAPNKVGTSETTTITNYDTTNTITSTTTTDISSPDATTPPDPVDQCKLHPDTVGCMPVGSIPSDDVIPSVTKNVDFSPVDVTSSSGCPAPISISLGGHSISISYDWICQYASAFKPLVLAAAWLSAALIVFGGIKAGQGA